MFKLIGMKRAKRDPHAYIVLLKDGAYWADENGLIAEPVAAGTFHRTLKTQNPFAEAILLASLAVTHFNGMETRLTAKIAGMTQAMDRDGVRADAPARPHASAAKT
jgi:hypothetical protein